MELVHMDKKLKHEIAELLYIAKNIDGLNVDLGNAVYGMIKMELLKYLYYLTSLNEFNDKQIEFIQEYLDIKITDQMKRRIDCFDRDEIENSIPNGLIYFVTKCNDEYKSKHKHLNICSHYYITYYSLGISFAPNCIDREMVVKKTNTFVEKLHTYIEKNLFTSDNYLDEDLEENIPSKGIEKKSDFLKCPNCRAIIKNEGYYCPECFEDFDDMHFADADYIDTSVAPKYYDISLDNENIYNKYYYTSEKAGIVISVYSESDEEYISDTFKVEGENIITEDKTFGESYSKYADYLYIKDTMYLGNIPETTYFEAYCYFNSNVRPIWFLADGSVRIYSGNGADDVVDFVGRYIREGELLRVDTVCKNTGEKHSSIYLIVNQRLCRDAYANENAMKKIYALKEIKNPVLTNSFSNATITEKEFFDNYPCPYCNARRCFNNIGWEYKAFGSVSVYGRCGKCNAFFIESGSLEEIKRIAYSGSKDTNYHLTAGAVRYLDNPCPYCGAYQVKYAKWSDKRMSVAFWGFFSSKLHRNYKCENCGKMWE